MTPTYKTTKSGNSAILDETERTITYVNDDDDSDEMYEFMRALQCNGNVKMWYVSGNHLYGGQNGIDCVIKPAYGIVDGADIAHRWGVTVSWRSKCEEPRAELVI